KFVTFLLVVTLTLGLATQANAIELVDKEYDWERLKGQNVTLNVFNWGEYMSLGQDDSMNVNKEFEKLTGIKVNYQMFANNEEMYTKLKSGGAEYDVVIPSDYMIGKMISEDMLLPLDFSKIPNFQYIGEQYKNSAFDPQNEYYVPYMWGTVGIIYNTTMVDIPVDSWDILWNEEYAGDILMFGNSRDAFAISLIKNGLSLNPKSLEDIEVAKQDLKDQKAVVQAYVNDEIFDKMGGGEAAIAPYYAGDAIVMMEENPDLAFVVPKEGTNYFVDGAVILKDAKNAEAAHMYLNFLCETEVAKANAEFIGYSTPQVLTLEELDEDVRNNPVAYPSQEVLAKTEAFVTLPEELNEAMDKAWSEIRSYNQESNNMFMPIMFMIGVVVL
ncbi:MAG: ABC transporter substrate-binding protein, partial [Oscillospiraceae bacterium]